MSDNEEAVSVVTHLHASRFGCLNSLDDCLHQVLSRSSPASRQPASVEREGEGYIVKHEAQ